MTAEYPSSIYSPRTKENRSGVVYTPAKTTVGYAEDITKLDAEVVAIENTLGQNPQGAYETVLAWLTALAGAVFPTTTQTLTNKRITKRTDSQSTTNDITPEISNYDIFIRTAQAHALVINNHSTSTPVDGDMMLFEILGDATPRAITYGDKYIAKAGIALPTTTVASKNLTMLFIWRNDLSKWNLLASGQEA